MHLLGLFKRKANEERLLDIVAKYNDDMQKNRVEVMEMIRAAVWCLQSDFSRRPSMSVVVKVLEGSVDVENNLDHNFTTPMVPRAITVAGQQGDAIGAATPLFASVLSRPRGERENTEARPRTQVVVVAARRRPSSSADLAAHPSSLVGIAAPPPPLPPPASASTSTSTSARFCWLLQFFFSSSSSFFFPLISSQIRAPIFGLSSKHHKLIELKNVTYFIVEKRGTDETEEDYLDQEVLGMPMRFSYCEVKVTDKTSKGNFGKDDIGL
ncbi:hypothetical protein TEA_014558 [Camellia sinensis var. sinensis]|uniref:Uncharacterized protein n=1 Tax=Camellia sinensis var. sinensis TaxID=542762 RepID=A0A4S4EBI1_CAMSN|nr:hypothetical protein TEA_014558 [Camellia sinensis var. sinensis]